MTPELYWIRDIEPSRLAIMARPRGGEWLEEEVSGWKSLGIRVVASLLHAYEADELGIAGEASLCAAHGIDFRSFPIRDRGVPESHFAFSDFVDQLTAHVRTGDAVAVHCRAGIGRSGLTVGAVLLRLGVPAQNIFSMVSKARGIVVPDTAAQIEWFDSVVAGNSARSRRQ
jgi:Protein-tyrosine phosphatase